MAKGVTLHLTNVVSSLPTEVPVEEDAVTFSGVRIDVTIHSRMQDSQSRAIDASVVDPTPHGTNGRSA